MKFNISIVDQAIETASINAIVFDYHEAKGIIHDFLQEHLDDADDIDNLRERAYEFADSSVDIYYHDIYESTSKFSEAIDQATEELGRPESIDKEIQQGQFYAYNSLLEDFLYHLENN